MATAIEDAVKVDKEVLEGYVRLQNFAKRPKTSGGFFGTGIVVVKGGESLNYKVWDERVIEKLEQITAEGAGFYLHVSGKGDTYNNNFSVIIEWVDVPDQSSFKLSDFYDVKLDVQQLNSRVNSILGDRVSSKGNKIVASILKGKLSERFVYEFAGMTMHDATPIGLFNHTTKMLEVTDLVMKQHNNFSQKEDNIDLIYIGVLLHDIGKTLELNDGLYTKISVATHRFLGAELIFGFKDEIVESYGELWYYNLISMITQHHGVYEERPRTIFAYIAHLVDSFDTSLTILEEKIDTLESGADLRLSEFRLKIEK